MSDNPDERQPATSPTEPTAPQPTAPLPTDAGSAAAPPADHGAASQQPAGPQPADATSAPTAAAPPAGQASSTATQPVGQGPSPSPGTGGVPQQAAMAEGVPPNSPPTPRRRWGAHVTRTWIAAVVALVLLLAGGVAGYAIGATDDHDGRPGWHERGWPGAGPEGFRGERRDGGR